MNPEIADYRVWSEEMKTFKPLTQTLTVFLPVAALIVIVTSFVFRSEKQHNLAGLQTRETAGIRIGTEALNGCIEEVVRDLFSVAHQGALRRVVDAPSPTNLAQLGAELVVFSRAHAIYDQIRWLDETGEERVRVNYEHGAPVVIPREQLQNKGERYYFADTFGLKAGEVFVSRLDLNIEGNKVEIPYKPMIRVGTPVFDSAGKKRGIVLLNCYGTRLIKSFESGIGADRAMLLNRAGYWLRSPRSQEEWGFMFKRSITLGRRSPSVWKRIQAADAGQFLDGDGLWTFETVYPLDTGQKAGIGASKTSGPSRRAVNAGQYHWKAVSHVPAETIRASTREAVFRLSWISIASLVLAFIGSVVLAIARIREANASHEAQEANRELQLEVAIRRKAEADLEDVARFAGENPSPVLRIDADGRLLGLYGAEHVQRDKSEPTLEELRRPSFGIALTAAVVRRAFAAA